MVNYIIVGGGLAGIAFAETALQNGKTIMVFSDSRPGSSIVAAGLYNPVILKRFSGLQNAQEQLNTLDSFYKKLESKLQTKFLFPMPIWRPFHSVEEQNEWFTAPDKPALRPFLSTSLHFEQLKSINASFGYGEVLQSGYVDTTHLVEQYSSYLKSFGSLVSETFDYNSVHTNTAGVQYRDLKADHIIFAEGFAVKDNPFLNPDALNGTKGELLIIRSNSLDLNVIVKAGLFVLPIGGGLYKVGATYEWDDKTNLQTQKGKQELIEKLAKIINCDYEVVDHLAGIRPTTRDRKAVIGTHQQHPNLHILNGLGTRGVMLAPYLARKLFDHIENGSEISDDINVRRYR